MELFREFFAVIEDLNDEGLAYSVVGGIALAFHSQPKFTRDIDILARPADLEPPPFFVQLRPRSNHGNSDAANASLQANYQHEVGI